MQIFDDEQLSSITELVSSYRKKSDYRVSLGKYDRSWVLRSAPDLPESLIRFFMNSNVSVGFQDHVVFNSCLPSEHELKEDAAFCEGHYVKDVWVFGHDVGFQWWAFSKKLTGNPIVSTWDNQDNFPTDSVYEFFCAFLSASE